MSRSYWTGLLALAAQLRGAFSYPANISEGQLVTRDDGDFIFAALGDSWAWGLVCALERVRWQRRQLLALQVRLVHRCREPWFRLAARWQKAKLEFKACSGSRTDNVMEQMVKTTRPKVTLMEISGNNADFYPMTDSCIFHSDRDKDYGTFFEDDDPDNPTGECWREIKLVRGRLESNDIKNKIVNVIHAWRGHPANMGNDASLFLFGYPWFFGDTKDCDNWSFSVFYEPEDKRQKLVQGLRTEFNKLIDEMNRNIREAVEMFQDSKIQYIDINTAFHMHRFCEPGSTWSDQLNWNNNVWIWNSPGRWWITIKKENDEKMYDMLAQDAEMPPWDEVEKMLAHPDGEAKQVGDIISRTYRDPDDSSHSMMWGGSLKDFKALGGSGSGGGNSVARTLHPTQSGHEFMGLTIVERLKQDFKGGVTQQPWGPINCPTAVLAPEPALRRFVLSSVIVSKL
ncbi:hypothetical protein K469DRAFT_747330 [Zopfia rhizophila CBS 207.26]|uniref:SGNH hydrolase-type esterase domain-containing protein n=1 Tax=Zopfia rhizophila CBS 207.26 TaxID=1314779 RepID=A0A6A6EEX5_9PEZI|nr:hypothetical protein K469DRAFT_747330 [Zopfia rhizophila CBS 207.26]